jgi:hypothetical protein
VVDAARSHRTEGGGWWFAEVVAGDVKVLPVMVSQRFHGHGWCSLVACGFCSRRSQQWWVSDCTNATVVMVGTPSTVDGGGSLVVVLLGFVAGELVKGGENSPGRRRETGEVIGRRTKGADDDAVGRSRGVDEEVGLSARRWNKKKMRLV